METDRNIVSPLIYANLNLLLSRFTGYNGRVDWVSPNVALVPGTYKLAFRVQEYYKSLSQECFYPIIEVDFYFCFKYSYCRSLSSSKTPLSTTTSPSPSAITAILPIADLNFIFYNS